MVGRATDSNIGIPSARLLPSTYASTTMITTTSVLLATCLNRPEKFTGKRNVRGNKWTQDARAFVEKKLKILCGFSRKLLYLIGRLLCSKRLNYAKQLSVGNIKGTCQFKTLTIFLGGLWCKILAVWPNKVRECIFPRLAYQILSFGCCLKKHWKKKFSAAWFIYVNFHRATCTHACMG